MSRDKAAVKVKPTPIDGANPRWWLPTSLALMLVGLVWVITYYISSGAYPVPDIDAWNIVIGFGFIMAGFVMLTRWK